MAPDLAIFARQAGDLAFVAGLVLMAILSAAAAVRIERGARVPMQWDLKGRPLWHLGRRGAMMFSPAVAAVSGLVLTAVAHGERELAPDGALALGMVRAMMALVFVVAHAFHLSVALRTLESRRR